jgi:hypothetical protein
MLIVCPFSRPQELDRVLAAWRAQTVPAGLLFGANERGAWAERAEEAGAVVLDGHRTIGAAKNAALRYARAQGEEWITIWDDDDYYGVRYVEQASEQIDDDVDVLTQGIGFVRFEDGLFFFEKPIHFCPGHCTTMRVSASPDFEEVSLGEDVAWTRLMDWKRIRQIPPWHSVYHRDGSGHSFDARRDEFMKNFEPCRRIGDVPDSFVDTPCDLSPFPYEEVTEEMFYRSLEKRLLERRSHC